MTHWVNNQLALTSLSSPAHSSGWLFSDPALATEVNTHTHTHRLGKTYRIKMNALAGFRVTLLKVNYECLNTIFLGCFQRKPQNSGLNPIKDHHWHGQVNCSRVKERKHTSRIRDNTLPLPPPSSAIFPVHYQWLLMDNQGGPLHEEAISTQRGLLSGPPGCSGRKTNTGQSVCVFYSLFMCAWLMCSSSGSARATHGVPSLPPRIERGGERSTPTKAFTTTVLKLSASGVSVRQHAGSIKAVGL